MAKQSTYIRTGLVTASIIIIAVILVGDGNLFEGSTQKREPSFSDATGWLNTKPLTLESLRGKVVLIDFWTYTCINWRRTLPYIREWASKYKNQGLVVISVHTPEFPFEHNLENIKGAIKEMDIAYPVAVDNNFAIWNSFQNEYWPALYLIDTKGQIRYQKFGEGDYHESEKQIQQLLKETPAKNIPNQIAELQPKGFEAAADWKNLKSPENYVGYARTQGFASPEQLVADRQALYSAPKQFNLNQWALSGEWIMGKDRLVLSKGQGKIIYRFHARDLNLIMGPTIKGASIGFHILIDGKPPGDAHGLDVDGGGNGTIKEQRMYQLIRQQGPVTEGEFQIEFSDPKVEVYDFTFG